MQELLEEIAQLRVEIQTLLLDVVIRFPFIRARAVHTMLLLEQQQPLIDLDETIALVQAIANDVRARQRYRENRRLCARLLHSSSSMGGTRTQCRKTVKGK